MTTGGLSGVGDEGKAPGVVLILVLDGDEALLLLEAIINSDHIHPLTFNRNRFSVNGETPSHRSFAGGTR